MHRALMKYFFSIVMLPILLLAGLPVRADGEPVDQLTYRVHRAGGEMEVSRLLIAPTKLRIDQGKQGNGFILYDKQAETIYSITPEERTILIIQPHGEKPQNPEDMKLKIDQVDDLDAPEVGGSKPEHWRMMVNGKICQEVILAPGLMSQSLALYQDYLSLLANQHAMSLDATPAEYRDPCDDAIHVFAPTLLLKKGLPIRKWDNRGNQESLVDFAYKQSMPADYFMLPEDYQQLPMSIDY